MFVVADAKNLLSRGQRYAHFWPIRVQKQDRYRGLSYKDFQRKFYDTLKFLSTLIE